MQKRSALLLVLICFWLTALASQLRREDDRRPGVFLATKNWQEIEAGQQVPSGLHYRINLQTGKKEAKLLEDDEEGSGTTSNAQHGVVSVKSGGEDNQPALENDPQRLEDVKRAMEGIKVNRDIELIKELVARFSNASSTNDAEKLLILEDLDYYLHQIDNARDFVKIGGLSSIIKPCLGSSNSGLVKMGAMLLGSTSQSNGPVQNAVLDAGLVETTLGLLTEWDKDDEVKRRVIYALSSITRGNRRCLVTFVVELQGIRVLLERVLLPSAPVASTKLKIKTLALVTDLWRQDANSTSNESSAGSVVDKALVPSIAQWCSVFTGDLQLFQLAEHMNLESVERISDILLEFASPCRLAFSQCSHLKGWLDKARRFVIEQSLADEDPMMAEEYKLCLSNVERVATILSRTEL